MPPPTSSSTCNLRRKDTNEARASPSCGGRRAETRKTERHDRRGEVAGGRPKQHRRAFAVCCGSPEVRNRTRQTLTRCIHNMLATKAVGNHQVIAWPRCPRQEPQPLYYWSSEEKRSSRRLLFCSNWERKRLGSGLAWGTWKKPTIEVIHELVSPPSSLVLTGVVAAPPPATICRRRPPCPQGQ